jgi:formylglycine-generating enzyme required for sulfatase activity
MIKIRFGADSTSFTLKAGSGMILWALLVGLLFVGCRGRDFMNLAEKERSLEAKVEQEWEIQGEGANHPIYFVSWEEAVEFCRLLTERENEAGRLPDGYVYRLPTEAEWEYAAPGGREGRVTTYSGSNDVDEVAWNSENSSGDIHRIGEKAENELGMYDMSGNLWEWVYDLFQRGYRDLDSEDPVVLAGEGSTITRVRRGGSWGLDEVGCRVSFRDFGYMHLRTFNGLRVVIAPSL